MARSLPLFLAAVGFFVAGVAVYFPYPHYGPGAFTLWALLFVLGFVAAIGGVASWLLAVDPASPAHSPGNRPLVAKEVRAETPSPGRLRVDFGRPPPAIWSEEGEAENPSPRGRAPPVSVAASVPPGRDVDRMLSDLDAIEHDLAPRAGRPRPPAA